MKVTKLKTCAYCKKPILPDEYGVFCPSCGVNYHKDCWLTNNGCVTEGCAYNRTAGAPADACPVCGMLMPPNYAFCKRCGRARTPEENYYNYPKESTYYIPETDYEISASLVGKASTYYMKSFADIEDGTKKPSFNIFACLLSAAWFLYRKMVPQATVVGLFVLLFIIVALVFPSIAVLSVILIVAALLACGFFANGIYMTHIDELTEKVKELPPEQRVAFIKEVGGTLFNK